MSNPVIEYLLSVADNQGQRLNVFVECFQIAIPNFPPESRIGYSVAPPSNRYAYIMYEFGFGEAMVPHAFDVVIAQGGNNVLNATISGQFISHPFSTFVIVTGGDRIRFDVHNTRVLVGYYESTVFYLGVNSYEDFVKVIDALRRQHTSIKTEELLATGKKY